MLLRLWLLAASLVWAPAWAKPVQHRPATELQQAIARAAKAYDVDPRVLEAIAHLESSGGRFTGLRHNRNGTWDVGAFQINSVHWDTTCKAYNVHVLEGNAMCAARLLKSHKRFRDSDPDWRGRYHSRTPSRKQAYAAKLRRVLAASEPVQLRSHGRAKP